MTKVINESLKLLNRAIRAKLKIRSAIATQTVSQLLQYALVHRKVGYFVNQQR